MAFTKEKVGNPKMRGPGVNLRDVLVKADMFFQPARLGSSGVWPGS